MSPSDQPSLFPGIPPAEPMPVRRVYLQVLDTRFPGATPTQRVRVSLGLHPVDGPLQGAPEGQTCGTCRSREVNRCSSKSFQKCRLAPHTGGLATDTRVRWPACSWWKPTEKSCDSSAS